MTPWGALQNRTRDHYEPLPLDEQDDGHGIRSRTRSTPTSCRLVLCLVGLLALFGLAWPARKPCDTIDSGYTCSPAISHLWGQYALWFAVPSDISTAPPNGCHVTLANVLSRHGGRDPTIGKTMAYALLIAEIQNTSTAYPGQFAFLEDYQYHLGADMLTDAGRQQMVNSGIHFYRRYKKLVDKHTPFVRAGGQARVIESAEKWLEGIAKSLHRKPRAIDLVIPEGPSWNNTLSHDTCPAFSSRRGASAQDTFAAKFVPPIQARVNGALGSNLSTTNIIYLMDMCPFDTVAHPDARLSRFCHLFSEEEWRAYDYYQSLGKFYGYGAGSELGPSQGVGYVNELLARLTDSPVDDATTTNTTLSADPATFPLGNKVYADFSHDNDIGNVLAALGLYNHTALSNTTIQDADDTGYSAAWTVPFASRLYIEKMQCGADEFVRVVVNDRVLPMESCGADEHGLCKLDDFVASQEFARKGGRWDECFE